MSLPTLVTTAPAAPAVAADAAVAVPSAGVLDLDGLLDPRASWYVL